MRIAFVFIPRLPCAVEVQRAPRLADQPLIVGDADQPKKVFDCSEAARERGVRPGMTVRQALGLCPEVVVLPPDPVLYRGRWEAVLNALDSFSPEVEDAGLGCAYLNVGGLGGHYRDETDLATRIVEAVEAASGLPAAAGIADTKFLAFAAAIGAGPGRTRTVLAGEETGFLAPLEVSLLPVDAEVIFRLHLLGLDTVGEVATLSLPELQSQFGFKGKLLWQLANGRDEGLLRPRPRLETLEASLSFEAPVGGIDVMVAAGRQLLSRLGERRRGRAVRELRLRAELISGRVWERQIVLREAVSESERLGFVLRSALVNSPPPNAVKSISLGLVNLTGETGKQIALGERPRLQRQLEEAIRQLKARYGFSPIYRCVDVEPWSVIPEEQQILVESDV